MAHATLVEQDATLAQEARATAVKLGVDHVTVVTGDAGETESFAFALPVDLLPLCGIFGNVSEEDVALTVAATPAMLRSGRHCDFDPRQRTARSETYDPSVVRRCRTARHGI